MGQYKLATAALGLAVLYSLAPTLFRGLLRLSSCPLDDVVGLVPTLPAGGASRLLRGKRALVVGGTRGIGRGIALTLAAHGAGVSIVGRSDGGAVLRSLAQRAPAPQQAGGLAAPVFRAHRADLSTVAGCLAAASELQREVEELTRFDLVVFTVGCWPNFSAPLTSDGVDTVVALDLLARHVLLERLAATALQPGARVMSTLASTQRVPFLDAASVRARLEPGAAPPGSLFTALLPVSVAADAWLQQAASHHPQLTFVGMFPGIVVTDLPVRRMIIAGILPECQQ